MKELMSTFMQWIHVTAAVIGLGGGVGFLVFMLMPSLGGSLDPAQRDLLADRVIARFRWVFWSVILLSALSGLYIIRQYYWDVAWGRSWALLTVKIVLALCVFLIAFALTLPFKLFDRFRTHRKVWLLIAISLATVVMFIAADLRR